MARMRISNMLVWEIFPSGPDNGINSIPELELII